MTVYKCNRSPGVRMAVSGKQVHAAIRVPGEILRIHVHDHSIRVLKAGRSLPLARAAEGVTILAGLAIFQIRTNPDIARFDIRHTVVGPQPSPRQPIVEIRRIHEDGEGHYLDVAEAWASSAALALGEYREDEVRDDHDECENGQNLDYRYAAPWPHTISVWQLRSIGRSSCR